MNMSVAQRTAGRTAGLAMVRAKKGVILFTHIRRAGGTVLEDYVLKPFVKVSPFVNPQPSILIVTPKPDPDPDPNHDP